MVLIKRTRIVIVLSFLLSLSALTGTSGANSQDHNHNTRGENNGHYQENYRNSYDDSNSPGVDPRHLSGVEW